MTYALDPEVATAFAALAKQMAVNPPPARGDWKTLRENGNALMAAWAAVARELPGVSTQSFSAITSDGASIELRWHARDDAPRGPAVIYLHGGGMVMGSAKLYDPLVNEYVSATGIPFLSVNYRLAPEAQGEVLAEDAFTALTWLIGNADRLGVDVNRIALMGDSAGGGVAAGAAILARDRGVPLARQILVYPMLDDQNLEPNETLVPFATWTYDDNFTGWSALLGGAFGGANVSPIAAPARLKTFAGLAPAYIEVGELDIFRRENLAYAEQLLNADVPVEFHLHRGAPHGFDRFAPSSQLSQRAIADRWRVIRSI